ncbi:hypothetical protein E4T52_11374 [Aureobasidium sp. EXF-3400]|nr:hypothetical protein E4T51_10382 [Aureobasidium sp. EXF-12344]KAI4773639.1 hypothetical protein E4T52_11374 [Aureobasidium sp. EXF-3400]
MSSRSRSAGRGDGLGASKNQQQHRRASSTPGPRDEFHAGFVKRLAGILDNHGKAIKKNSDFLSEISSTLRSHSYSRLPRPVSEPALKVPTTPIVQPPTPDDTAPESSSEFMPPTPPDTPTVEVSDWSQLPPTPSEVRYHYEQPKVPKIIIKDHSTSTTTTISAPVDAIMDLSISSQDDADAVVTTSALNGSTPVNHNTSMVPVNRNSIGLPNTSPSSFNHATSNMAPTTSSAADSVDHDTVSEDDISQWYVYHADRAAKSLRYDLREIDLKMDRFVRRINELNSQCSALNDLMSAHASNALNPNTQQHRRTRSTPAVQGNDHFTRKEKQIRDDIKEAFQSLRSALTFYRKQRVAPLELVNAKADVVMPGYWSLDAYGKRRALFHFYNRNKDISRPGDRARYHDAMALLDACTAMSLNQDFVDKIDRWESQIGAMKSESGANTVIP